MEWVQYVAKAVTAFLVAGLAAIIQYNVDVNPWVMVAVAAVIAGLGVFLIPNGARPEGS